MLETVQEPCRSLWTLQFSLAHLWSSAASVVWSLTVSSLFGQNLVSISGSCYLKKKGKSSATEVFTAKSETSAAAGPLTSVEVLSMQEKPAVGVNPCTKY